jgi:hypothetical protein
MAEEVKPEVTLESLLKEVETLKTEVVNKDEVLNRLVDENKGLKDAQKSLSDGSKIYQDFYMAQLNNKLAAAPEYLKVVLKDLPAPKQMESIIAFETEVQKNQAKLKELSGNSSAVIQGNSSNQSILQTDLTATITHGQKPSSEIYEQNALRFMTGNIRPDPISRDNIDHVKAQEEMDKIEQGPYSMYQKQQMLDALRKKLKGSGLA